MGVFTIVSDIEINIWYQINQSAFKRATNYRDLVLFDITPNITSIDSFDQSKYLAESNSSFMSIVQVGELFFVNLFTL